VSKIFASVQAFLRHPRLHEVLRWCLPALLIGLVLRVMITVEMPYAYYHDDGPDFLCTPDSLIHQHKWEIHEKKTFLVPILFTLPFALPAPALVTIPILQHVLGLGLIVLIGALCRLWLKHWKVFIIPLTVLAAVNPFFLWYEQTVMAETTFVVCTVFLTVIGTLFVQRPTATRLGWLIAALVLEAGARPEGKLLFGFALFAVVLIHWGDWRQLGRRFAVVAVAGLITHFATKTSQAGLLLYTSVARLTPANLTSAPGFDPYIAKIREDLQARWEERPQFPRVRDRKAIAAAVGQYLKDDPSHGKVKHQSDVNIYCLSLAKETCLRSLPQLPGLAGTKFRLVANESPAGRFDNEILFGKQREAYVDNAERTVRLSKALVGAHLPDEAAINGWMDQHYGEVPWFNTLSDSWLKAVNALRLPDRQYPNPHFPTVPIIYYGVPLYFLLAGLGLVVLMFRRGTLQRFHVAWGLTLLAFFFTIMLTANVRPRFRFVFEPFWFLYIAALAETLWIAAKSLLVRR